MSKYDFVSKLETKEIIKRIETTGSDSFKEALKAELVKRGEEIVEVSQEAVEEIPEEVDANVPDVPVEAPTESEEVVETPVKAPAKRGRRSAANK